MNLQIPPASSLELPGWLILNVLLTVGIAHSTYRLLIEKKGDYPTDMLSQPAFAGTSVLLRLEELLKVDDDRGSFIEAHKLLTFAILDDLKIKISDDRSGREILSEVKRASLRLWKPLAELYQRYEPVRFGDASVPSGWIANTREIADTLAHDHSRSVNINR